MRDGGRKSKRERTRKTKRGDEGDGEREKEKRDTERDREVTTHLRSNIEKILWFTKTLGEMSQHVSSAMGQSLYNWKENLH